MRRGQSTSSAIIRALTPADTVTLVPPDTLRKAYYHVAIGADTGWAYSRFLSHTGGTIALVNAPTSPATSGIDHPAEAISPAWEKTAPNHADMTHVGGAGVCHWYGSPTNTERNVDELKNRTDIPAQYHAVTWDALAHLDWPREATTHRQPSASGAPGWTGDQLNAIAPYEREALVVTGFIAKIRPQAGNHEATNCGWGGEDNTDWHIEFVGNPGQDESEAIVVETTPRVKRDHPNWARLREFEAAGKNDSVRVYGWLMLDPEHKGHLGKYRQTLWEIHPITRIDVFKNGRWWNLDSLP